MEVEKEPDEDLIRFKLSGLERMSIRPGRMGPGLQNSNTIIGENAGPAFNSKFSNTWAFGNNTCKTASDQERLGNSSITSFYCQGAYEGSIGTTNRHLYLYNTGKIGYVYSSEMNKEYIQDIESIDWTYNLRPVSLTYYNR